MHEGHHGVISKETRSHASAKRALVSRSEMMKALYPGLLLVTILVSLLPGQKESLGFDFAVIPMLAGGAYVLWSTLVAVVETKKMTAGVLVVLALAGSGYIGEYLAAAVVAFMMIVGEFLEDITLERTRNAVRELVRLAPDKARVRRGGEYVEVPAEEVRAGDVLLIKPGDRVPVDGVVISGQAALDESSITGESMPVDKSPGARVFAGTINLTGALEVEAEKVGENTTLGRIIGIVYEAQNSKGRSQRTADRFAQFFTPIILGIALLVWFLTHDLFRVMSVLVIACPCALVLATPTAVVASVGNAARRGALIKGGITLEKAGRVSVVCFDKTGTLTQGRPQITEVRPFTVLDQKELIATAAAVEKMSEHPIAKAIVAKASDEGVSVADPEDFSVAFGQGVRGKVESRLVEVGNRRLLEDAGAEVDEKVDTWLAEQEKLGRAALVVMVDGEVVGGIAVADSLRHDAARSLRALRDLGIKKLVMLTGDNSATARAIAAEAGITEVKANLLPEEKLAYVKGLQLKHETVAMVGDGVNDAPALTLADVGIAMGAAGTDVAIESSDIALMADNLTMVADVLALSRKAVGIIQQNIWLFAVAVNVIGVSLASLGILSPIMSAVVHNVASVFVVLNSARLLGFRLGQERDHQL
ncbi:MAG: heavy metal translocating P-type ATPase [Bacillota bacterium]